VDYVGHFTISFQNARSLQHKTPSICRYLCTVPVNAESFPLWIPHISHVNNNVKSRVPSSQEKILISASTTPFVLRVSVFDCQLGSSVCLCQYESCSIRLGHVHFHRSTCPITAVLYSHRPLPKLALFNTETLDLSDGSTWFNKDTSYKTSSVAVYIQQFEIYWSWMCWYFLGWDELGSDIYFGANGELRMFCVSEFICYQVANILLQYDGFTYKHYTVGWGLSGYYVL
jgi:hypothetical protein